MSAPPRVSKVLLTISATVTLVVPAIADFNATHVKNPLWAPHARLHGAALLLVNVVCGAIALYLVWGRYAERGSRLAVTIAAALPALCWGALFAALLFPGTSSWPDGVSEKTPVNGNLVVAGAVVVMCALALIFDRRARRASPRA